MQLIIDCKNDLTDIVTKILMVATLNVTPPKSDNSDDWWKSINKDKFLDYKKQT